LDRGLLGRALWLGSIEAALCYTGFFAVYLLSGNAAILQVPFLKMIPILEDLRLKISPDIVHSVAITVFHAGVVMSQVGNAFACRSSKTRSTYLGWLSNRYLLLGVAIEISGIVALIYIPFLGDAFNHSRLPAQYWLGLSLFGPVLYSLEWIRKAISRRLVRMRVHQPRA
jgi:sodium/potassium-transporting ATPase subunit alpha